MPTGRAFCAEVSRDRDEPMSATASRLEHWLLVEYRHRWERNLLDGSLLSPAVKEHLRAQLDALPRSRLLFIRKPERRAEARLKVFVGRTTEEPVAFRELEVDSHDELVTIDLTHVATGRPIDHPLLVVCTHGKRDRCCAKYGRPLYRALEEHVDPSWVWKASHVGGDRFAGNLVCFPEGLYFGRVTDEDVGSVVDEYLAGTVHLERYRGRCCYPFRVQAAEHAIRQQTGIRDLDAFELADVGTNEDAWLVEFREKRTGELLRAEVERRLDDQSAFLTCDADTEKQAPRYVSR